jgi:hypothetical protein
MPVIPGCAGRFDRSIELAGNVRTMMGDTELGGERG